jgi:predicted transcriptional regulator
MKYRSRTDIITAILATSTQGATKTRIMYGAYLSYAQAKEYLDFLVTRKLLVYDEDARVYRLSEIGMTLLHTFEGVNQLLTPGTGNGTQAY